MRVRVVSFEALEARVLPALTVTFDYSLDQANGNFFSDFNRRFVVESAINAVASNLLDTLFEIIPHKDNPADTWTLEVTNPATGSMHSEVDRILGENEIVVFLGARQLGDTQLGEGTFGGVTVGGTQSFANLVLGRGQAGALGPSQTQTDFSLTAGSMTFDSDTDWYFGSDESGIGPNQADFYSVAMHEFAHLVGFGTALSFQNLVNGTSFGGPQSLAEYDLGGNPPLSYDQGHWAEGTTDEGRETALDPSLLLGTRKTLAKLDYAGLADLGWQVQSGAGTGGGGPTDPRFIKLDDGSDHTLIVRDDGVAGNGLSEYVLDNGTPVAFPTDGGNVTLVGGNMNDTVTIQSFDVSFTGTFQIDTAAGDDDVNFDHGAKNSLSVSGGAGSDELHVTGAAAQATAFQFTGAASGTSTINDGSVSTVSFAEFEAVTDLVATSNRTFNYASLNDVVTLQDDGSTNGMTRLAASVSNPAVTFSNPGASLIVDAGLGNDSITLDPIDSGFAALVSVMGGDGDDFVSATNANFAATLEGANGNDTLIGGSLADLFRGGSNNDSIVGGDGNDSIIAGIGNDTLQGGNGNDVLNGGNGDDVLFGGLGNDTLTAGGGLDTVAETGDVNFTLTPTTLTGMGTDTLLSIENALLTGGASGNVIDVSAFTGPATLNGEAGPDSIIGSAQADRINGQAGHDTILSGAGNDVIVAGEGHDSVSGGTGADSIDGGDDSDTLSGDDSNDTISGGSGNDVLMGFLGNDSLLGGDGSDLLDGGDGNDVLNGEGNDFDSIIGGLGNDTLGGGSGNDVLIESADVNFVLTSISLTGLGTDSLAGLEFAQLTGGDSNNSINASAFSGAVTLRGGAGNDTLTGGIAADFFSGEAGNDSILGQGGADSLFGGAGADFLNGGDGNDSIYGQGGSLDSLYGGTGNDLLDGGIGNDTLFGEDGNDTLLGFDGVDYLSGGNQDDSLLGGLGDDTLLGDAGNDTLNGGDGNDILNGGDGNDGLSGFNGNDNLTGAFGNDTLYGGSGNDSMFGGSGNDILIGQGDADALNGNSGLDTLVGGNGTGTADTGDFFADVAEVNEFFRLNPEPDWVLRTDF